MPSWKQKQPTLEELLDADVGVMVYLTTLKSIPYHRAIIARLEGLIVPAEPLELAKINRNTYRENAVVLYKANLMSLLKYS